jgi:tetratricopeptide (TPR) repeat protein
MKSRLIFLTILVFVLLVPTQLFAKDTWINVRSKNFFLIGNANEKEIRQVATKLEQFRETFRIIFPKVIFASPIPINVLVFKSSSAYNPFRPKLANGKPDENIAGYFQANEDVNYITVSTEGEKDDTFGTIFHEYVHYILDTNIGKSDIPPWFNEGLAEYYQTYQIKDDQKVSLGDIQSGHLQLLQQSQLIPLKTFFEIDNYSLHQNGNHSRSIFYAQAWALIHYLIQGNKGANNENLTSFLNLILNKVEPEKAFQQVFKTDYAAMEKALKNYVSQGKYQMSVVTFDKKLVFDSEMTTVPLSEGEANAYLGDLLYHTREYDNAETYLKKALAADPNSSLANTSLGLVRMKQRKFGEAKQLLETAIAKDQKNYLAYYNYAFILSRESMDEFGYVSKYPADASRKITDFLSKAIELNPNFSESYSLVAFVYLVNSENLDQALNFLKKGLALQPGNQQYSFMIAQVYSRQQKFAEARALAEKLFKTADEPNFKNQAENLLKNIVQNEASFAEYQKNKSAYDAQRSKFEENNIVVTNTREKPLTPEEIKKIEEDNQILEYNRLLQKDIAIGEKQIIGYVEAIKCVKGTVNYSIKTPTETLNLSSKDFANLKLVSYAPDEEIGDVGCNASLAKFLTVLRYVENKDLKIKNTQGTLTAIYFVPKYFKLKTPEELAKSRRIVVSDETLSETSSGNNSSEEAKQDYENKRRELMLEGIRNALRKPQADEKRVLGFIEKIECGNNSVTFVVKTEAGILKLKAKNFQDVKFAAFVNDANGLQFGCGAKLPPINAIITYRVKGKDTEAVSFEFVPKSITIEN